jgi:UV DNA damage repair endonuclease
MHLDFNLGINRNLENSLRRSTLCVHDCTVLIGWVCVSSVIDSSISKTFSAGSFDSSHYVMGNAENTNQQLIDMKETKNTRSRTEFVRVRLGTVCFCCDLKVKKNKDRAVTSRPSFNQVHPSVALSPTHYY